MAALARALQRVSQLQGDPDFADQLERRVLQRQTARPRPRSVPHGWGRFLPRPVLAHPALASALRLCLLVILLGSGVLVAAAQVTDPTNPLYALKHGEQQTHASLSGSPAAAA